MFLPEGPCRRQRSSKRLVSHPPSPRCVPPVAVTGGGEEEEGSVGGRPGPWGNPSGLPSKRPPGAVMVGVGVLPSVK